MKEIKGLLIVATLVITMVPGGVHPGGEPPPIHQEINNLKSELQAEINSLEHRVNEHSDRLSTLTDASIEELVQRLIDENPIVASMSTAMQDVEKLKLDAASIVSRDKSILEEWIFPSVMGFIGGLIAILVGKILKTISNSRRRHKASRKVEPTSSPQTSPETEPSVSTSYVTQKKKDDEKDSSTERRVVTHTEKETGTGNILALCNPGADWSPRPIHEAIKDIRERGIRYVARGPMGNEAEIEVHERQDQAFLKTKPDQHGGNNLGELPAPL